MRMMMCIVQQNEGMGMKGEVVVPDNDVLMTTLAMSKAHVFIPAEMQCVTS